jgi:hypothetical protein
MNRAFILLKTSFYLRLLVARLRVLRFPPAADEPEQLSQAAYSGFFVFAFNQAMGFGPQFFFGFLGSLDQFPMLYTG